MATLTLTPSPTPSLGRSLGGSMAPAAPAARPMAAGPLHLTRRGRLVVTVLALVLILGMALGTAGRVAAGSPAQAPALEAVVVQPGQSLWGFAAQALPGIDTREAVLRIRELNALEGARANVIHPGQVLLVPAS
jgi:hypothetical protein